MSLTSEPLPSVLNENFKDFIQKTKETLPVLPLGPRLIVITYLIILAPFLIVAFLFTSVLALFIPLASIFLFIKFKASLPLIFVLHVFGFLDLLSDWILFGSVTHNYYSHVNITSMEKSLFDARIVFFLWSGIPGLFLVYFWVGSRPSILSYAKDGYKESDGVNQTGTLVALVMVALWKALCIIFRFALIAKTFSCFLGKKDWQENIQKKEKWLCLLLYVDLVWSSLPLGILSIVEVFNQDRLPFYASLADVQTLKLISLVITMISGCYLIYFEMFGLEQSCCGEGPVGNTPDYKPLIPEDQPTPTPQADL